MRISALQARLASKMPVPPPASLPGEVLTWYGARFYTHNICGYGIRNGTGLVGWGLVYCAGLCFEGLLVDFYATDRFLAGAPTIASNAGIYAPGNSVVCGGQAMEHVMTQSAPPPAREPEHVLTPATSPELATVAPKVVTTVAPKAEVVATIAPKAEAVTSNAPEAEAMISAGKRCD